MDIFTIQEEAYKRGYEAGVKSVGDKMKATDIKKLVELMKETDEYLNNICIGHSCDQCPYDRCGGDCDKYVRADYLIDHGVCLMPEPPKGE